MTPDYSVILENSLEDFRKDSIKYLKENYGYIELDENDNKTIEVSHDDGAMFKVKTEEFDKNINKVKKLVVNPINPRDGIVYNSLT